MLIPIHKIETFHACNQLSQAKIWCINESGLGYVSQKDMHFVHLIPHFYDLNRKPYREHIVATQSQKWRPLSEHTTAGESAKFLNDVSATAHFLKNICVSIYFSRMKNIVSLSDKALY